MTAALVRTSYRVLALASLSILLLETLNPSRVRADDAEIVKLLKDKGAMVTEAKGVVTGLNFADASKLTDEDFAQIGKLSHLKSLSLSKGLTDKRLEPLTSLTELELLQTNLMEVSDDGLKQLAKLKKLKNLKLFHPGKDFSGTGLAHLAELPKLDQLTVAGSFSFNDDGMAAVAKLPHLQEFRMWHAGPTNEGVKKLKDMPSLKSLHLGQRLTYKTPACPDNETIAILAEFKALETLQLDEARLSKSALLKLKSLAHLKKLTLGGIEIPEEEVVQLKKDLPEVKIDWTEPNDVYRKRIRALFGGDGK